MGGLLKRLYKQGNAEMQEKNETDWCTPTVERLTWLKNTYGVYVIHPSFRIIALARPPLGSRGLERGSWMTSEVCTMFPFVWLRALSAVEEKRVILARAPNVSDHDVNALCQLAQTVRSTDNESDEILSSLAESL